LSSTAEMLLAALWLLLAAAGLGLFTPNTGGPSIWRRLGRGVGAALAIWAAAMLVGLAAGSSDPVRPLAVLAARTGGETAAANGSSVGAGANGANGAPAAQMAFAPIQSTTQLDALLKTEGRPAMLDFYADWCVSCKEMERFTFSDKRVQARLAQLHLLRADVTANNPDDQTLLKRFGLFGPPGIIFFDRTGKEVLRVVGYEPADTFLRRLDRIAPALRS
jgi:thioredoxin:protein disulfide reductase